jgi:hypothetical protein
VYELEYVSELLLYSRSPWLFVLVSVYLFLSELASVYLCE